MRALSRRRWTAVTVGTVIFASVAPAGVHAGESASAVVSREAGFNGFMLWTKDPYKGFAGSYLGNPPEFNSNGMAMYGPPCASTSDPACEVSGTDVSVSTSRMNSELGSFGLVWTSVLPVCATASQMNCVAGLMVGDSSTGASEAGVLITEDVPLARPNQSFSTFTGDLSRLIPNGGRAPVFGTTLWPRSGPGSLPWGARVRVAVSGQSRRASCDTASEKNSHYCRDREAIEADSRPDFLQGFTVEVEGVTLSANTSGPKTVLAPAGLPANSTFSLSIRLSSVLLPRGWMSGRMVRPTVTQTPIDGGFSLEFSGGAAQVPTAEAYFGCSEYPTLPERVKEFFEESWKSSRRIGGLPAVPTCSNATDIAATQTFGHAFSPVIIRDVLLGRRVAADSWGVSTALETIEAKSDSMGVIRNEWALHWKPESLPWDRWDTGSPCNSIGLVGVIGTNAALYGEFPIFDPTTGRLGYRMLGAHYLADGTLNRGTLSMVMRRDYAVCQWGIDPATNLMSAVIENPKTDETNPAVVETSVDGDFFRADARDITFSAPRMDIRPARVSVPRSRTVRVKKGSVLDISTVVPAQRGKVASWYVQSGSCRIKEANTRLLRTATKGGCRVVLSVYDKKTRKATRTMLLLP